MHHSPVVLFAFWESFLLDLLSRTGKFRKDLRFTLTQRIDNTALDVMELLIEARWQKDKKRQLELISVKIDKLRILLRLSVRLGALDKGGYEHLIRGLDEAGRMVGGWIKQQGQK